MAENCWDGKEATVLTTVLLWAPSSACSLSVDHMNINVIHESKISQTYYFFISFSCNTNPNVLDFFTLSFHLFLLCSWHLSISKLHSFPAPFLHLFCLILTCPLQMFFSPCILSFLCLSTFSFYLSFSKHLLTSPLRVCKLLSLNDFLLPPPVNRARFDQANEIENFHLRQIDFKPETTCGQGTEKKK